MKKIIKLIKAFSIIEVLITLIAVSIVATASAPVITKRVEAQKALINTAEIKTPPNCSAFGDTHLECQLCYTWQCLVCRGTCPSGYTTEKEACKCITCASLGFSNCDICSVSPKKCTKCKPGYWLNASGKCQTCTAGNYCSNGVNQTPCPAGKYGAGAAARTACTDCSKGTAQGSTGQAACPNCNSGKYQANTGKTTCDTCSAGTYSPTSGAISVCTNCYNGKYQTTAGKTSCDTCSAGSYTPNINVAHTTCTFCTAGQYNNTAGRNNCDTCGAGKYNTGTGNTGCTDCGKGYACSGGANRVGCYTLNGNYTNVATASACSNCGSGKFSVNDSNVSGSNIVGTKCNTCSAGYSCTSGVKTACGTNKCALAGASSCSSCSTTCSNNACSVTNCNCTSCASGYYKNGTVCSACPTGCSACSSATSCSSCSAGYYLSGTTCKACEAGYACAGGTAARTTCYTNSGNYSGNGASTCSNCGNGKFASDASGNWNGAYVGTKCNNCPANWYCISGFPRQCPVGQGSSANSTACSNCAKGQYAPTVGGGCSNCPAMYRINKTGATACVKCADGKQSSAGASVCTDCQAGYKCVDAVKTACATGRYSAAGATACTKCPKGKYNPFTGQSSCPYKCSNVTSHCKTCNRTSGLCGSCASGYTLDKSKNPRECDKEKTGSVSPCTHLLWQCSSCNPGGGYYTCVTCKSGYKRCECPDDDDIHVCDYDGGECDDC